MRPRTMIGIWLHAVNHAHICSDMCLLEKISNKGWRTAEMGEEGREKRRPSANDCTEWVCYCILVRCQSVLAHRSDYSAILVYKLKRFWHAFKSPECSRWAGAASTKSLHCDISLKLERGMEKVLNRDQFCIQQLASIHFCICVRGESDLVPREKKKKGRVFENFKKYVYICSGTPTESSSGNESFNRLFFFFLLHQKSINSLKIKASLLSL